MTEQDSCCYESGLLVQRRKQFAAVRGDQRVIVAQQVEHLQQSFVRNAFVVAAIAHKEL